MGSAILESSEPGNVNGAVGNQNAPTPEVEAEPVKATRSRKKKSADEE